MARRTLEDKLKQYPNAVEMLRNAPLGPYEFPIKSEFTNWRDEQEAWRKSAVLFDQSYHMTDFHIQGRDVKRLISDLAINSQASFARDVAKQIVVCNPDGYYVGDAIMFILENDYIKIVGKPNAGNWIHFNAETKDYNVKVTKDDRSLDNSKSRKLYRFEVQGPNAWKILEKANGGPITGFKFFRMGEIKVKGRTIRALRHGMAGAAGLELFGPYEQGAEVKGALLEAGKEFGLLQAGAKTYATVAHESGWFPAPMPAIYTGAAMEPYRKWLPAEGFEANISLGGSMVCDRVEDYYLTPYDLGYGHIVKFDHDFVGKAALQAMADRPHRRKVTLKWAKDDVVKIFASLYNEGDRFKFLDMPASHYASMPYDLVLKDGKSVGISHYPVYSSNVRAWISLALVNEAVATPGTAVDIVWGEPNGGSRKPTVERHIQTEVRAEVHPCPIAIETRQQYKKAV